LVKGYSLTILTYDKKAICDVPTIPTRFCALPLMSSGGIVGCLSLLLSVRCTGWLYGTRHLSSCILHSRFGDSISGRATSNTLQLT